jgi:hypothetical protein
MIAFDKKYVTKHGEAVRLISNQGSEKFPIIGIVDGDVTVKCWTKEGRYNEIGEHFLDLVEVKTKVKYLKSMAQLLTEFPHSRFTSDGVLSVYSGDSLNFEGCLHPTSFRDLGKPYDYEKMGGFINPIWFEEREED